MNATGSYKEHRPEWLRSLDRRTLRFREQKASRLEAIAQARQKKAAEAGQFADVRWHRSRAEGQLHRIERVARCSESKLELECMACGVVENKPARCRCGLACVSCRGRIAMEKRSRFRDAREIVVEAARRAGLLIGYKRYSEKLVTLTMPHDHCHGIRERIDIVRKAWPKFLKRFNGWLRKEGALDRSHWYRTLEWTPGSDGQGHPHLHIWTLCPYLVMNDVVAWWHSALIAAGFTDSPRPSVNVQEVSNGPSAALEVIKYLTKDIVSGGLIDPAKYALVYEALDGTRVTQASRGFMALAKREATGCQHCGAQKMCRVTVLHPQAPPQPSMDAENQQTQRSDQSSLSLHERLKKTCSGCGLSPVGEDGKCPACGASKLK